MNHVQVFLKLVSYLAFLLFRWLFGTVQSVWWLLNGTYPTLWENTVSFEKSAHVLEIWWRRKFSELILPGSLLDFVTVHSRFEHPSIVLRDNVTLYAITKKYGIFVEVEDGVDVANSNLGSFLKISQFQYAHKVIILPMKSFHQLAEEVGGPLGPLVFLANTGRCGSTLLCQIFEETQRWVALAEPEVINTLSTLHGSMDDQEFQKLAYNTMRLLCKPLQCGNKGYLIKVAAPGMVTILLPLHKLYPNAKLMFMYRDGLPVAQSMTKMREQDPMLKLIDTVMNLFPTLQKHAFKACGFSGDGFIQTFHSISRFFMVWAVLCAKYKEFRKAGVPIVGIRYEDMVANPEYATTAILENSDSKKIASVEKSLVVKGLTAFGRDSQRDSVLSRERVNRHSPDDVTPEVQLELDAICEATGLPRVPEPCLLPQTITAP